MFVLPKISDIEYFTDKSKNLGRKSNDHNNNVRETIIRSMPYIDNDYLSHPKYGIYWFNLKRYFKITIRLLCPNAHAYSISHKAGRRHNYDYVVTFFDLSNKKISEKKLEFKFNATTFNTIPQFVSPMKPSKYINKSFEKYYYDNYLVPLLEEFELPIPERDVYLKQVHNNKPKCMSEAQLLYYQGCKRSSKYINSKIASKFYQNCIDISKECIHNFILESELNIEKLNEYLFNSQCKKYYLFYKDGKFNIQTTNSDDYKIVSYLKQPKLSRYEALTASGKHIHILLRWKNGNGIAYPAFQIK